MTFSKISILKEISSGQALTPDCTLPIVGDELWLHTGKNQEGLSFPNDGAALNKHGQWFLLESNEYHVVEKAANYDMDLLRALGLSSPFTLIFSDAAALVMKGVIPHTTNPTALVLQGLTSKIVSEYALIKDDHHLYWLGIQISNPNENRSLKLNFKPAYSIQTIDSVFDSNLMGGDQNLVKIISDWRKKQMCSDMGYFNRELK